MSRCLGGRVLTLRSPTQTLPPVMVSRPEMSLSSVLLPQPEGPTSTINSPSSTVRLMSLRTGRLRSAEGFAWFAGFAWAVCSDAVELARVCFEEESPEKVLQIFSRTTFAKAMLRRKRAFGQKNRSVNLPVRRENGYSSRVSGGISVMRVSTITSLRPVVNRRSHG